MASSRSRRAYWVLSSYGASSVACPEVQPGGARRCRAGAPVRRRPSPVLSPAVAKTAAATSAMVAMPSPTPPFGRARPLPRQRISMSLPSAPRVLAAILARAPAGPSAARGTLKCFVGDGEGDAEPRAPLREGDAEARAALDGAAVPARMAVGTVVTISAAAATWVAVCSGAPTSPRNPLLRVIISVVSCRVQVGGAIALGRARNRKPGHAATAQSRTCRSRLRGDVRQIRGICPDSCAWPSPDRNPALLKGIRTGATGSRAPDVRRPWSTMASNSGELHRVQASAPVWREYPSRAAPCGRLGCPVTHATGRIPPKGPKGAQHHHRQSAAFARATALC